MRNLRRKKSTPKWSVVRPLSFIEVDSLHFGNISGEQCCGVCGYRTQWSAYPNGRCNFGGRITPCGCFCRDGNAQPAGGHFAQFKCHLDLWPRHPHARARLCDWQHADRRTHHHAAPLSHRNQQWPVQFSRWRNIGRGGQPITGHLHRYLEHHAAISVRIAGPEIGSFWGIVKLLTPFPKPFFAAWVAWQSL